MPRKLPPAVRRKISANLKRLRKEAGLTQKQLDDMAGVTGVAMLEQRGSGELGVIYAVASALGRPLSAIFEGVTAYAPKDARPPAADNPTLAPRVRESAAGR